MGGLTVLKALREELPSADVVYFGDTKNAPYGEKSRAELGALTVAAIERLQKAGATSIVSACNSVSASLAVSLFDTLEIKPDHLIEMVGPTVSYFKHSTHRLLLAATPATIESEIYQNAFHMIGKEIATVAIPELAGAIEKGASDAEQERIIREAFANANLHDYDLLILACTHYPLALASFEKALGELALFDPATAVAERAKKQLWPQEVGDGQIRFLISAESTPFRARVAELFPESIGTIEVVN
jgi:glutamate racemase